MGFFVFCREAFSSIKVGDTQWIIHDGKWKCVSLFQQMRSAFSKNDALSSYKDHIPKTLIKTFIQQNAQQTRRIETHHQAIFCGCSVVLYPLATSEHRSRAYDNFEKALSNWMTTEIVLWLFALLHLGLNSNLFYKGYQFFVQSLSNF